MATRDRYSYVRIARAVEPTEHVSDFFEKIRQYSEEILPQRRLRSIPVVQTLEDLKQQGIDPAVKAMKVTGLKTYNEDDLSVLYYERRLPRSQRANSNLIRLLGKLSQINYDQLLDEPSPEIVHADSYYVIDSTSRLHFNDKNRREFSLVLEEGPACIRFLRENRAFLSKAGPSIEREYMHSVVSTDVEPTEEAGIVPVFTVPARSDAEAVNALVDRVNLDGIASPLVTLNFMVPELQSKLL